MTNTAYEATNSDVEKLIADIGKEAAQAKNYKSLTVTLSVNGVLALIAALEQAQRYAKKRDEENQDLMLTIGRLRVEREQLEAAPNAMMQLSNELAEMKRKCVELQEQKDKWAAWAISLGAKADELESRPPAMRCVKLPSAWIEPGNRWLQERDVIEAIRSAGGNVEGSE